MPLLPLKLPPGVVKDNSDLLSEGRYIDAQWTRFRNVGGFGQPQAMGGYQLFGPDRVTGIARGMHSWENLAGQKQCAIGTHAKLFILRSSGLYDITPLRVDDSLGSDPITTDGTTTVNVEYTAHGAIVGDSVYLTGLIAVGGQQIGGTSGTFATDPFLTTDGTTTVIVTLASHGLVSGEMVTISSVSGTQNGIPAADLNKRHTVYVLTDDAFEIEVDTPATSTATAGGTPDYALWKRYEVTEVVDADNFKIAIESAATAATGGGASGDIAIEINVGLESTTTPSGYGTGGYSVGPYSLSTGTTDLQARTWSLKNFGEILIAQPWRGETYQWQNNVSQRATALTATDAPEETNAVMVTPERFLFALGTETGAGVYDPLLLRWATQEGYNTNGDWTAAATNTAGDFRLSEGSRIMGGAPSAFVSLIWTDTAAYQARYLADSVLVYGFDLLGTNCGLIGPNAFARAGNGAIVAWLSPNREFFVWSGGAPAVIDTGSDIRDYFFSDLAPVQEAKIYAGVSSQWNEIWWWYPTLPSNECAKYVAWNYKENHWTIGTLSRTAWQDRGVFDAPLAVAADGSIYAHETGETADGAPLHAYVESGYVDIGEGEQLYMVRSCVPDFKDQVGGVNLTITGRVWPNGTNIVSGPHVLGPNTLKADFRITARQMKYKLESNSAPSSWRLGSTRLDAVPTRQRR